MPISSGLSRLSVQRLFLSLSGNAAAGEHVHWAVAQVALDAEMQRLRRSLGARDPADGDQRRREELRERVCRWRERIWLSWSGAVELTFEKRQKRIQRQFAYSVRKRRRCARRRNSHQDAQTDKRPIG